MKILVTGGAGYIGSHTAKALKRAEYDPVVFDDLTSGHPWAVKWGPLVEGSLADTDLVRKTLTGHKIEAVIHFAASLLVSESMTNPQKYFWNNVVNTLRLLDAMLEAKVKHIVFSSSAATYGIPQTVPIPEDHPKNPINAYGETKLSMERAIQWYGTAYGVRWMALRYFNAAGADAGGESCALNLGTGQGNSVREVIHAVGKMCGGRVPYRDAPRRSGDPPSLVADPSRANRVLAWKPRISSLDSIVESAWNWHSKNRV